MPETATQADETVALCAWPRRNRQTGRDEQLRVAASDFGGRIFLHCRMFYSVSPRDDGDDSWRPDRARGVTIRENELDELAEAVERARALVRGQGRSTSADAPTRRSRRA